MSKACIEEPPPTAQFYRRCWQSAEICFNGRPTSGCATKCDDGLDKQTKAKLGRMTHPLWSKASDRRTSLASLTALAFSQAPRCAFTRLTIYNERQTNERKLSALLYDWLLRAILDSHTCCCV
ncbi:hypothetical protein CBOM_07554 [Ceraceosorus bombacis]|uniref:Uncharacterized protein n=1 Tax=Ceraceosorus bombacis TaxID=401625 RepID=A0A0P1BFU5_9BASI|nr:hypothetical protein CBOM_07554 [Ceraceosorus bombacis]